MYHFREYGPLGPRSFRFFRQTSQTITKFTLAFCPNQLRSSKSVKSCHDKIWQTCANSLSKNLNKFALLEVLRPKNQWRYGSSGLRSWLQKIGNLHLTSHRVSVTPIEFPLLLSSPSIKILYGTAGLTLCPTLALHAPQCCKAAFAFSFLFLLFGLLESENGGGTNVQCAWHHGAASSTSTDVVAVRFNFLVEARLFESRREFFPPSLQAGNISAHSITIFSLLIPNLQDVPQGT